MFVLGIFLIIILAVFLILYMVVWAEAHDFDCILKINYKQFISMYAINPKAWELADNYTVQYTYSGCRSMSKVQWFYFGPIDTLKYWHFRRVEKTQIPKEILKEHLDYCFRIPMIEGVRSLNLSNCVAIVVYEILRQKNYEGLSGVETIKGADFLEDN